MSMINDGGPAFPVPEVFDERRGEMVQHGSTGMSLRDYFAGLAMQGMLTRPGAINTRDDAQFAYKMADAMLAERANSTPN